MTEKEIRDRVVGVAQTYIGIKKGSKAHHKIIKIFNTVKPKKYRMDYQAHWCAAFATGVIIEALGRAKARRVAPMSSNCDNMIRHAKKMKCWKENDAYIPNIADLILYDWDDSGKGDNRGSSDHVGIVEKVEDDIITVIEGNYDNKVKRRKVRVNGKYIRGYVTPLYKKLLVKKTVKPTYLYTTQLLALREGASTKKRIITVMPKGAKVRKLGSNGSWIKVRYEKKTGYAYSKYLSKKKRKKK